MTLVIYRAEKKRKQLNLIHLEFFAKRYVIVQKLPTGIQTTNFQLLFFLFIQSLMSAVHEMGIQQTVPSDLFR